MELETVTLRVVNKSHKLDARTLGEPLVVVTPSSPPSVVVCRSVSGILVGVGGDGIIDGDGRGNVFIGEVIIGVGENVETSALLQLFPSQQPNAHELYKQTRCSILIQ